MLLFGKKTSEKIEDGFHVAKYHIQNPKLNITLVLTFKKNQFEVYPNKFTLIFNDKDIQIIDYNFKPTINNKQNGKATNE